MNERIGFLGSGKMASAIVVGWVAKKAVEPRDLVVFAPSTRNIDKLREKVPDLAVAASAVDVVQRSSIVIIAVKPHHMTEALAEVRGRITPAHLVVSIAAGISTAQIEEHLCGGARVIRLNPNTACAVGANAGALCRGRGATTSDVHRIQTLFAELGADGHPPPEVEEKHMDVVTALAGSGPAFVMTFIEALADGAVYAGLPRHIASRLAAQTVMGGAKLVLESGMHPAALRDDVCSPGGTTAEGILALETGGFRATAMKAVISASAKGAVLAQMASKAVAHRPEAPVESAASMAAASATA
jgi:pyrroline-5-carboxylate reductase